MMAHNNSGANNVAFEFLCRWSFPLPEALWAVKKCPFFAAAPLPRGEGRARPSCSHVLALLMEMVLCPAARSAPAWDWSCRAPRCPWGEDVGLGVLGCLPVPCAWDEASKVLSWWGFPHGAVLELPFPEAMAVVRVTAPAWPQLFLEMCEIPSFDPSPPLN